MYFSKIYISCTYINDALKLNAGWNYVDIKCLVESQ